MARLSERIRERDAAEQARLAAERQKLVNAENFKLLAEAWKRHSSAEIPEELYAFFKKHNIPRINNVFFRTFAETREVLTFNDTTVYGCVTDAENIFGYFAQSNTKSFPNLILYHPVLSDLIFAEQLRKAQDERRQEQERRFNQENAVCSRLADILHHKYGLQLPEMVKSAVHLLPHGECQLPLPEIKFDGSHERVKKLATMCENATFLNDCLLIHDFTTKKDDAVHAWTIYVPDLNPVTMMSDYLAFKTRLPAELCLRIAQNADQTDYYGIYTNIYTSARAFAASMVKLCELKKGDHVFDLAQGEEQEVIFDEKERTLLLDIDDEKPSAIVVKSKTSTNPYASANITIFYPGRIE